MGETPSARQLTARPRPDQRVTEARSPRTDAGDAVQPLSRPLQSRKPPLVFRQPEGLKRDPLLSCRISGCLVRFWSQLGQVEAIKIWNQSQRRCSARIRSSRRRRCAPTIIVYGNSNGASEGATDRVLFDVFDSHRPLHRIPAGR